MLPRLLPMLAVPARPFDSAEYSFEVKWDGVRALAAVETAAWQLWGPSGDGRTLAPAREPRVVAQESRGDLLANGG
jgi:hypothetical protein